MSSVWTGDRVRLRGIEPEDWETLKTFSENSLVARRSHRITPPRSDARERASAQERALREPDNDTFRLAIESLDEGALVGTIGTHWVDQRAGRFSYGIELGPDHHRRGYASDAVPLLLGFMFRERRFHKCAAEVFAFNEPSLAFHRSLGFAEEGRLREHEFHAGRHHDVVCFGITAPEFERLHPQPSEI